MTKEENSLYLLVKNVLAKSEGFHKKLPKTMTTVRWIKALKEQLTIRYGGFTIDVYGRTYNHWHGILLCGEMLNQAVKYMLIYEITASGNAIMTNPHSLPHISDTECMSCVEYMLSHFLPSRLKNQGFNN